mmetsp:Transcript_48575/g.113940  ORF Transcript_48575/g.113940 Transcript_48575/m.113940 type:complete len:301 (-) Transcript_48575:198-1100(-)
MSLSRRIGVQCRRRGAVLLAAALCFEAVRRRAFSVPLGSGPVASEQGAIGQTASAHLLPRQPQVRSAALPEALSSVQDLMQQVPDQVAALGPAGIFYFFGIYVVAECLALPAAPLTLSSGYLFGLPVGAVTSVLAGTTAAAIGFLLSRTFLRPQIQKIAEENETFRDINKAVEREGFKIILLLRLSPLLPFALSNYVYGLSKVGFGDFILATALGFAPGTIGLVYAATTARELTTEGASQPWYVYAAGLAVTVFLLKVVSDVASQAVKDAVEDDAKAAPSPQEVVSGMLADIKSRESVDA